MPPVSRSSMAGMREPRLQLVVQRLRSVYMNYTDNLYCFMLRHDVLSKCAYCKFLKKFIAPHHRRETVACWHTAR